MNATPYVARMRQILHDFETPTSMGLFWQDEELVLCLNVAQYSVLNAALRNGTVHILDKLIKRATLGNGVALPSDYCQALTGKIQIQIPLPTGGTESRYVQSRLYEQGEALNFLTTNHSKILIIEEKIYPYHNETKCQCELTYITYPSEITLDPLNADYDKKSFEEDVYRNIITVLAVCIAGYKEFNTNRDTKYYKKLAEYLGSLGKDHLPYLKDIENVMPVQMKPSKEDGANDQ